MAQKEIRTEQKYVSNWLVFTLVSIFMIAGFWWTCRNDKDRLAKAGPAVKCLSAWDGSHPGMVRATKDMMNDPKSFEHVETRYIDRGEEIDLVMTFTGKNAFGGTIKQIVSGTIDKDCNLIKGPAMVKI